MVSIRRARGAGAVADPEWQPNSPRSRVVKWLERNPRGGLTKEMACDLDLHPRKVNNILRRLEPGGEVFQAGGRWFLTATLLRVSEQLRQRIRDELRGELERAIFGERMPEWFKEWLRCFAAGSKVGMDVDEAYFFAKRELLKAHPMMEVMLGEVNV